MKVFTLASQKTFVKSYVISDYSGMNRYIRVIITYLYILIVENVLKIVGCTLYIYIGWIPSLEPRHCS